MVKKLLQGSPLNKNLSEQISFELLALSKSPSEYYNFRLQGRSPFTKKMRE